jgi:RecB family endonuclease NucS
MPVEQAIWRIGDTSIRLKDSSLDSEHSLEEMICKDIAILNDEWLLIGRQVPTAYNKSIDLLAIDATGSLIIIELKKKN